MANVEAATVIPLAQGGTPAAGLLKPLLICTVLAVFISLITLGGAIFWLSRTGHLPSQGPSASATVVAKADPPKMKSVALEPLLVNLADDGGHSYLRIAITVQTEEPPPAKGEKAKAEPEAKGKAAVSEWEAPMRDTALEVLGRERSQTLLASDGKQLLKNDLHQAFTQHVPGAHVRDVLFTEFLVQQ